MKRPDKKTWGVAGGIVFGFLGELLARRFGAGKVGRQLGALFGAWLGSEAVPPVADAIIDHTPSATNKALSGVVQGIRKTKRRLTGTTQRVNGRLPSP